MKFGEEVGLYCEAGCRGTGCCDGSALMICREGDEAETKDGLYWCRGC